MLEEDFALTRRALAWMHGFGRPDRPDGSTEVDFIIDMAAGHPLPETSYGRTKEAEDNLGWPPSVYWYVGTIDDAFGDTVIGEWNPPLSLEVDSASGSAAPFDTGGFAVSPSKVPVTGVDSIGYIRENLIGLTTWHGVVRNRIANSYADFGAYVRHDPPASPMSTQDHSGTLDSRIWTWEARVAKHAFAETVGEVDHLFWRSEERRRLAEARLEDRFDAEPSDALLQSQRVIAGRSSASTTGNHRLDVQEELIRRERGNA